MTPATSLSYAERAKKAQNIRSPIAAPPPPQPQHQPQPQRPVALDTPSASTVTSSFEDTPNSSLVLPTRPPSPSPPPAPVAVAPSRPQNGSTPSLAAKALSIVEAHTSPPKPVGNFWQERAAARAASTSQKPSVPVISTTNAAPVPSQANSKAKASPSPQPSLGTPPQPKLSVTGGNQPQSGKAKSRSPVIVDKGKEASDPFVVQMPDNIVRPPVVTTDSETWPEVGKSQSTAVSVASQVGDATDGNKDKQAQGIMGASVNGSGGGTPKKGAFCRLTRSCTIYLLTSTSILILLIYYDV